jgi:hypothetical protein
MSRARNGRQASPAEHRYRLKRRALLAALGGTTLGAFVPRLGIAQSSAPIKRLVLVFQPNGVIMDNWRPAGGSVAGTALGELSRSLAAFEPIKGKTTVVTGLNKKSFGFDNHQQGMGGLWTGSRMLDEAELSKPAPENAALADGPSIDQVVAQASKGSTRFDSLQFQVDRTSTGGLGPGWMTTIYSGPKQPMIGENNPYKMFDRVFEGNSSGSVDQAEQLRAERKSVLDRVATELSGLSSSLGKTDRLKLEQHLTHVRSIERRLVDEALIGPSCEPTALDAKLGTPKDPLTNANYPEMVRLQTDIAVLALGCDLTRVLSLQFSYSVSGRVFNWLGYDPPKDTRGSTDHHDHSHDWDLNDISKNYLSDIDRWYGEQVAYLASSLDAVQDGDATLLDNTCVVWGNEIARGGHSLDDMPFLVVGGAAHGMPQGKNFDFRGSKTMHNRLLVSLGRGMGLSLDKFGTSDEGSGGLPGFV